VVRDLDQRQHQPQIPGDRSPEGGDRDQAGIHLSAGRPQGIRGRDKAGRVLASGVKDRLSHRAKRPTHLLEPVRQLLLDL
jgi:hypothetical protein